MADDSGNIDGYTEAMEKFSPQPPKLGATPQIPGAGMEEMKALADAVNTGFQKLTQYVSATQQGFAAYKSIAGEAAHLYLSHNYAAASKFTDAVNQDSPVLRGPANVPALGGK